MSLWDWTLRSLRPARRAGGLPDPAGRARPEHLAAALGGVGRGRRRRACWPRAAEAAHRWEATALVPLRAVRRALKAPLPPVADEAREGLREDVKAAELRAERVLMETLEGMGGRGGGAHALAALEAASAAWGKPAPANALAALAAALG